MQPDVRWRIFYGDETTVDDGDVDLYDVPGVDVQAILQADEDVGRYVLHAENFYWWDLEAQQWFQSDQFGLWDYLTRPGPKKVLFGRSRFNVKYKRIMDRVYSDPDFAPKSGRRIGETL